MREEAIAIGYLCPRCGQAAVGLRARRDLAAGPAQLSCRCGASALKSAPEAGALHMTVPCGLCGGRHHAVLPAERLLAGDTALDCPRRRQFCCFLGQEGAVERRTEELALLAAREKDAGAAAFTDSVIMYEVLSELRDIAARPGGIACLCGGKGYSMEVRRRSVDIICAACGARLRLGAATDRDLDDLCCRMKLRLPGRPPADGEREGRP